MQSGYSPTEPKSHSSLAITIAVAACFIFTAQIALVIAQESSGQATSTVTTTQPAQNSKLREEIKQLNLELEAKKDDIGSLQQQIEGYNQKIQATRSRAATIENEVDLLDNKLKKTELDIDQTQAEIDAANLEIRALDLEIQDKTESIARGKEIVAEYLRAINLYDDRSELEVLLRNDSFSEFFDQIKYLEEVERDLSTNLTGLISLKSQLETERQSKESKKLALSELQKKLDQTRYSLDDTKSAKEILVVEARANESTLKKSIQELKNEQARIESDLSSIESELKDRLRRSDKFATLPDDVVLSWPVDASRGITTYFHDPDYPFRYVFEHPGLDIRAAQGTAVRASAAGFVGRAHNGGLGYSYVMIIHSEGISTVYGHLTRIIVSEDEFVERGQVIGYSGGMPGTAGAGKLTTGPHLHFEVRSNGIPVNPLDYLLR